MALTEDEQNLAQAAVRWVRKGANKRNILQQFLDVPASTNPLVFFMAGSPGAGKTEVSKELIAELNSQPNGVSYARIDPDEIRDLLPGYNGKNAYIFQRAISIIMDDLISELCKSGKSAIVDGTLAHYENAQKNIQKVIKNNGKAAIFYIYQDPKLAWQFTQEREAVEGRRIDKDAFIKALYSSKDNVNSLKAEFGAKLVIFLVEKDYRKKVKIFKINIEKVDDYVKIPYTPQELEKML